MRVTIQKWGNSLALRIPKSFAEQASIKLGSLVNLSVEGKKIIIQSIEPKEYELKTLLSEVNESNLHTEYLGDDATGKENW